MTNNAYVGISRDLWLVGSGPMAVDYAKVLKTLEVPFSVIGRSVESAQVFERETRISVFTGGLDACLENCSCTPRAAIVAVSVEELAKATFALLVRGVRKILVEKPGGLYAQEMKAVANAAKDYGAKVYVAYNRRFYASVIKAKEIILDDGGVTSYYFDFTEWSHVIEGLKKPQVVKENWFLANSSHVVDMAFYLGGIPKEINYQTSASLAWHPSAAVFTGSGVAANGALFSYHANWQAPGRWGVEILTPRHRLIFRPLEQLHLQKIGSVEIVKQEIDDYLDVAYKPGLYRQVSAFLQQNCHEMLSIEDQVSLVEKYYLKMANYRG
ncbi:gfo/Idh/MocA family oxidoreductase [Thermanaerosceptrum fracticalcis]|uniref:Gfo/Idh/MocA family oxidoreductase n=2 Tax=Thermanaerosceptrum fracticalcis TaxID=1712410 RepID=A0A7G6E8K7_THEFR|nr:gfo/Idh/MocA family oxidoreductase [Thermanaerosceptrum fracticalcis]